MGRFVQIAVDCNDPERPAAFWADALRYEHRDPPSGYETWIEFSRSVGVEPGDAWTMIIDPEGRGPSVLFHKVPEPKTVKNRVHLDIVLDPGAPSERTRPLVDAKAARLVATGGIHLRTDDDGQDYYAVMQDPEGNEFCVG